MSISKIKEIKIREEDGSYSDPIPMGADAKYIDLSDGDNVEYAISRIKSGYAHYYDNIESMKNDIKLKENDVVETLGYYKPNDGGGANYYITNIVNTSKYQITLSENLYAELIIDDNTTVLNFGAKNNANINDLNNSFDSTSAFNLALQYVDTLKVPYGNYKISSVINLAWGKSIEGDIKQPLFIPVNNSVFNLVGRNKLYNLAFRTVKNNPTEATLIEETPTFITGILSYSEIKNITIGNAYIGMDLKVNGNSSIKNIKGLPLKYGIKIDNSIDIINIDNVNFNPNYYGTPSLIYLNYLFNNAYALYIGKADWGFINNLFIFGYAGICYTSSGSEIGGSANNFIFNNFGVDACKSLFKFLHNAGGFKFINGYATFFNPNYNKLLEAGLNPSKADTYPVSFGLNNSGKYESNSLIIENCNFFRADNNLLIVGSHGELIFKNNYIKNIHSFTSTSAVSPVIIIDSANANPIIDNNIIIGNLAETGEKQGILNNKCSNAIVSNNRIMGYNQPLAGSTDYRTYYSNNNITK